MSRRWCERILGLGALAIVTAACVSGKAPGVRVDAVQADIVFGVEKPPVGEVPPPTVAGIAGDDGSPDLRVPFRNQIPNRFSNVQYTVSPGTSACRDAPATAAPAVIAPANASAPPAAGLYTWRRSGKATVVANGSSYDQPISGLERRLVREVKKISDTRWTFDVAQPDLSGATLVTSYAVNTNPTEVGNPATGSRGVAAPYVGETTRAGEPLRGLTLHRQAYYDGNGTLIGDFSPADPVLLTPLPILSGDTWTSVGVDPRSGQTIRVDGIMARRESVDACGTRLDAWLADLTVAYSGASSTTRKLGLHVSTELGALPIGERISESSADGSKVEAFFQIGQRNPDPEPKASS